MNFSMLEKLRDLSNKKWAFNLLEYNDTKIKEELQRKILLEKFLAFVEKGRNKLNKIWSFLKLIDYDNNIKDKINSLKKLITSIENKEKLITKKSSFNIIIENDKKIQEKKKSS